MPEGKVNDDRLYRALDRLLPHKDALETHPQGALRRTVRVEYDLLLYDVTSTYFEGQAEGNPLAQRGYFRDHRPDCKQVCIGLVVTREGFPLGYEVFAGNTHDSRRCRHREHDGGAARHAGPRLARRPRHGECGEFWHGFGKLVGATSSGRRSRS